MVFRLEFTYERNIKDCAYQNLKVVIKIIINLILHFFLFSSTYHIIGGKIDQI